LRNENKYKERLPERDAGLPNDFCFSQMTFDEIQLVQHVRRGLRVKEVGRGNHVPSSDNEQLTLKCFSENFNCY